MLLYYVWFYLYTNHNKINMVLPWLHKSIHNRAVSRSNFLFVSWLGVLVMGNYKCKNSLLPYLTKIFPRQSYVLMTSSCKNLRKKANFLFLNGVPPTPFVNSSLATMSTSPIDPIAWPLIQSSTFYTLLMDIYTCNFHSYLHYVPHPLSITISPLTLRMFSISLYVQTPYHKLSCMLNFLANHCVAFDLFLGDIFFQILLYSPLLMCHHWKDVQIHLFLHQIPILNFLMKHLMHSIHHFPYIRSDKLIYILLVFASPNGSL